MLTFLHRPGNIRDSKGAKAFILQCVERVRESLPGVIIEVRMGSAFFSDEIISVLDGRDVELSIRVLFKRFAELKQVIEGRKHWYAINAGISYFEASWEPKS